MEFLCKLLKKQLRLDKRNKIKRAEKRKKFSLSLKIVKRIAYETRAVAKWEIQSTAKMILIKSWKRRKIHHSGKSERDCFLKRER